MYNNSAIAYSRVLLYFCKVNIIAEEKINGSQKESTPIPLGESHSCSLCCGHCALLDSLHVDIWTLFVHIMAHADGWEA